MKKTAFPFLVILCALLTAVASAQEPTYDVPFVPTRNEVVDVMLTMAGITKDDVVYDLGCGDGRIVVTAAQRYGARGVGIDINPTRIKESTENAEKNKVTDRVRFIKQDLFEADIREASVVSLYLLPDVNLKLRPNLFKQLKPGTRVVSHNYSMGEWEADAYKEVPSEYYTHYVYYWVIPANVSGTWQVTVTGPPAKRDLQLFLNQKFQHVTGTAGVSSLKRPVELFTLTGNDVAFTLDGRITGGSSPVKFTGTVKGDFMEGTAVTTADNGVTMKWSGRRDASTIQVIHRAADDR